MYQKYVLILNIITWSFAQNCFRILWFIFLYKINNLMQLYTAPEKRVATSVDTDIL